MREIVAAADVLVVDVVVLVVFVLEAVAALICGSIKSLFSLSGTTPRVPATLLDWYLK